MNKAKKTALYGVLTALALILGYIETLIPAFVAIPGMKIGLTNIVVLFSLYAVSERAAIIINIVRIIVLAMLFGSPLSFVFSLVGGCLSTAVMILLKKSDRFGMVGVSIAGGVTHNIGQIIVAMLVMNTKAIALYLPVLWITGIFSGMLVGFIGGLIAARIRTD
ncbi:MAG: Gx transporter family protein [Butyrivibrio sp.]|nr:Gx transporter family protein [Butyrivibrio sp.]